MKWWLKHTLNQIEKKVKAIKYSYTKLPNSNSFYSHVQNWCKNIYRIQLTKFWLSVSGRMWMRGGGGGGGREESIFMTNVSNFTYSIIILKFYYVQFKTFYMRVFLKSKTFQFFTLLHKTQKLLKSIIHLIYFWK